jgi:phosphoribosylformylglycinamidine synthase
MTKAKIHIGLKPGVLDPEGRAVAHSLDVLGFAGIGEVRKGKYFEIGLDEPDPDRARATAEAMCRELLANPVIETYRIDIEP